MLIACKSSDSTQAPTCQDITFSYFVSTSPTDSSYSKRAKNIIVEVIDKNNKVYSDTTDSLGRFSIIANNLCLPYKGRLRRLDGSIISQMNSSSNSFVNCSSCHYPGGQAGGYIYAHSGGSTEPVREIAVGGDLAMNRAVKRVKPSQTNPALLYQKLKEYNNSINGACPLGGYYQTGGNTNDYDMDGVFPGGYYLFSSCIIYVPNEYAIPVYVYVDGYFKGLDPNDYNPYVYKAVLQNLFFLIYIQDPFSGNGYFFAGYYPHDTLYVSGMGI